MISHISNPWNYAVAYVEMRYGKHSLSSGSCFFWVLNGKTYLVTNWHNLSGRNPLTGQAMSPKNAIPDRIVFMAFKQVSQPDAAGFFDMEFHPIEIILCNRDFNDNKWFEHPTYGCKVDVAVVEVTEAIINFQIMPANELESDAQLDISVAQDIFVVGFPFGLIANAPTPIWKHGTIALDPSFDPESLPKILIDTTTREGMSGSLVIARHFIVGTNYSKKNGSKSEVFMYAKLDLVIGVYSGRYYPDLEKAQLGIVWKRNIIEEIIVGKKLASV